MKKIFSLFLLCAIVSVGFAQKVKIKDGIASVDEQPTLKWEKGAAGEINISGINSTTQEIFATYLSYNDPGKITNSNPEGKVRYIELNFLTLGKKCEIDNRLQSALVKFLLENKVYVDSVFNAENAELVITKYGTRYTENRPANVHIYVHED